MTELKSNDDHVEQPPYPDRDHVKEQLFAACVKAKALFIALTESGLFDELACDVNPDEINGTCDAVDAAITAAERERAQGGGRAESTSAMSGVPQQSLGQRIVKEREGDVHRR